MGGREERRRGRWEEGSVSGGIKKPKGPILLQNSSEQILLCSLSKHTLRRWSFSPIFVTLLLRNSWLKSTRPTLMSQRGTGRLSSQAKASRRLFSFHHNPTEARAKPQKVKRRKARWKQRVNHSMFWAPTDIQDNGDRLTKDPSV